MFLVLVRAAWIAPFLTEKFIWLSILMVLNKSLSVLCLSFCLWLASCAPAPPSGSVVYTSFPSERRLQGRPVSVDTALFRYPFRVRVQGDRAAVLDLHGTDHFVHLFSYPDFRYVASCARRGEGPEETLSAENIRWKGDCLQLLDANRSELTVWQEAGDTLVRRSRVKLDEGLLRALDFVQGGDTAFLVPDYSGDHRFCVVSPQGRLLRRWGVIPTENAEALQESRPALAQAWRRVLELWNLRDSTHVVLRGPGGEPEFRVSQGYGLPTGIMGFSDVQVGDSAVYAVFHGRAFRDIMQAAQQGETLPDGGKYLYVFSLRGEPRTNRYGNTISAEETGSERKNWIQKETPGAVYLLAQMKSGCSVIHLKERRCAKGTKSF